MLGRPTIRRESENFITRLAKEEANPMQNIEEVTAAPEEDFETPAFIRRSLKRVIQRQEFLTINIKLTRDQTLETQTQNTSKAVLRRQLTYEISM